MEHFNIIAFFIMVSFFALLSRHWRCHIYARDTMDALRCDPERTSTYQILFSHRYQQTKISGAVAMVSIVIASIFIGWDIAVMIKAL